MNNANRSALICYTLPIGCTPWRNGTVQIANRSRISDPTSAWRVMQKHRRSDADAALSHPTIKLIYTGRVRDRGRERDCHFRSFHQVARARAIKAPSASARLRGKPTIMYNGRVPWRGNVYKGTRGVDCARGL